MLRERDIEQMLRRASPIPPGDGAIDLVLKDSVSCCFCHELFPAIEELIAHLRDEHPDGLPATETREVREARVEPGDTAILICPFCFFAVSDDGITRATTAIIRHVESCEANVNPHDGAPRVSFVASHDHGLIDAYATGHAVVQLFQCELCSRMFGSRDSLVAHLAVDHGHAVPCEVRPENAETIRGVAARMTASRPPPTPVPAPPSVTDATATTRGRRASPPCRPRPRSDLHPPAPALPPRHRVKTVTPPPPHGTRAVEEWELRDGVIVLPAAFRVSAARGIQVSVRFGANPVESLHYDRDKCCVEGVAAWLMASAVEVGDIVHFRATTGRDACIHVWTEWEKNLSAVLRCPPEDLAWSRMPIRDCLLRVFSDCAEPMHYRAIYAQISKHRKLAIGSVIATLSKHRSVLFEHVGQGEWKRLPRGRTIEPPPLPSAGGLQGGRSAIGVTANPWPAVGVIEKGDHVYKLLDRLREDLSFDQICQRLAETMGIDWHALRETGFIDASDPRLRRLTNGRFVLTEWFDVGDVPSPSSDSALMTAETDTHAEYAAETTPVQEAEKGADPGAARVSLESEVPATGRMPSPGMESAMEGRIEPSATELAVEDTEEPSRLADRAVGIHDSAGAGDAVEGGYATPAKPGSPVADVRGVSAAPETVESPAGDDSNVGLRGWRLRQTDGDIYGPVPLPTLVRWAQEGRVLPDEDVSEDSGPWVSAPSIVALGMVTMVRCRSGGIYGPVNPLAVDRLVACDQLAAGAFEAPACGQTSRSRGGFVAVLVNLWRAICTVLGWGRSSQGRWA